MRCGTSFYNVTLGKQLTLRFWPLAALYTLVLAILFPLRALTVQVMSHAPEAEYYALADVGTTFYILLPWGVLLAGGLGAMVVCSHLYSTRSCNFTAALAPKRTALFATHYLTGLLWLVVPFLVTSGAALAIFLAKLPNSTPQVWEGLGRNMVSVTVALLLFYSFGVLCGMLTGHLLALPVFYLTFNFLVAGVWYLLTLIFKAFYYGYSGSLTDVPEWVVWLTPALRMARSTLTSDPDGVTFGVYALVGVLMALGAWLLYVKRAMERAGDVVVWTGLRPVFRYGVALCAGLALGSLTRLVLDLEELGLVVATLLWGVVGCFVAQMFLTKSVRVLRYWKGAAAIAATFAALFVVMLFDLTGYETRVPATDQVTSVTISGLNSYPTDTANGFLDIETRDPEAIALITQLHQNLVDQQGTFQGSYDDWTSLDVTYTLSNGTRLTRHYSVPLSLQDVSRVDTITYLATQLVNHPGLMYQSYLFERMENLAVDGYRLTGGTFYTRSSPDSSALSASEARQVYQAIVQDIQEGNLTRTLFYETAETYIDLVWSNAQSQWQSSYAQQDVQSRYITVNITDKAVHTLEALDALH